MAIKFKNNATSKLAAAILATDTSIGVYPGEGALFPVLTGSDYFICTIENTAGEYEIVKVTATTGDTFTIERAQEGTSARAFSAGATIELRLTAASIETIIPDDYASTAEAQAGTVTNKIMSPALTTSHFNNRVSAFAKTLLDDTTAADARATLGSDVQRTKYAGIAAGTYNMVASEAGKTFWCAGGANIILPQIGTLAGNEVFEFIAYGAVTITVYATGTDRIYNGASYSTSITLANTERVKLLYNGATAFIIINSNVTISDFAKTLLDDTTAAAARTTIDALKNITYITTSTDFDTLANPGFYSLGYAGTAHSHAPTTDAVHWSVIVNQSYNGNNLVQIATNTAHNRTYIRTRSAANYTSWIEIGKQVSPKILTFTRDMSSASGNVDYTGLGFQPSVAMVIAGANISGFRPVTVGFDDGANRSAAYRHDDSSLQYLFSSSASVYIHIDSGAYAGSQTGTISMLSDGVRIAWTKNGADPRGTITGRILCWK